MRDKFREANRDHVTYLHTPVFMQNGDFVYWPAQIPDLNPLDVYILIVYESGHLFFISFPTTPKSNLNIQCHAVKAIGNYCYRATKVVNLKCIRYTF